MDWLTRAGRLPVTELGDTGNLVRWNNYMAVLPADAELGASFDVLLLGDGRVDIVDSNVEQVHSRTVLAIVSTYVGLYSGRFHHDGHSVQSGVAGVKYVSRHGLYHRAAELIERAGQIGSD